MYLKFCQIASEELTYSGVLILLAAGKQAECVVDSELGCVKLVFLKAMSNGLGKIDFGVVFADWLWQSLPKNSVISRILREHTTL